MRGGQLRELKAPVVERLCDHAIEQQPCDVAFRVGAVIFQILRGDQGEREQLQCVCAAT